MQYKGFTKQARKAMRLAENLAEKEQQTQMGSEYLLAGLLLEPGLLPEPGKQAPTPYRLRGTVRIFWH